MVKLLLIGALVVLVLVLLLGLAVVVVAGQAVTALDSATQQWLENRRQVRIEKARRRSAEAPALLARVPAAAARRFGRDRSQVEMPSPDGAVRPRTVVAAPKSEPVRLTVQYNSGPVLGPPGYEFQVVCACPHCDWVDTHDLRAPVRPAVAEDPALPPPAGEPTDSKEQPWWQAVVDWFGDAPGSDAADGPGVGDAEQAAKGDSWWDRLVGWFDDDTEPAPRDSGPSAVEDPDADHPEVGVVRTCRSGGHVWGQR